MSVAPQISVQNAQRRVRVDLKNLRAFADRALPLCLAQKAQASSTLASLSSAHITLISDARMAALHKQFMNIDEPTDVLTFQHGEIVISVESADENARRFRTSLEHELRLYLVHGLLHLHGFDDTTAVKSEVMSALQRAIVSAAA